MKTLTLSAIAFMLLLNGCGGDVNTETSTMSNNLSSDSNNNTPMETTSKIGTGYYVDAAVEGVNYICGSQIGTTDQNGTFTFQSGEDCNFTIGDLLLREVNASSLEDNITIFENNVEVAQFLQTMDIDGNASNGITIDLNSTQKVLEENDIKEIPKELALLDSIKEDLSAINEEYQGRVVNRDEVEAHLEETEQELIDTGAKLENRHTQRESFDEYFNDIVSEVNNNFDNNNSEQYNNSESEMNNHSRQSNRN